MRSYADPASPLGRTIQRQGRWSAYLKCQWDTPPSMSQMVGAPWTIGYGTTGPDVGPKTVWTVAKCKARYDAHVRQFLSSVTPLITLPEPVGAHEVAALLSLAYNIGASALRSSTLLRKFNAGDRQGAADQFLRWNKAQGKVLPGLTARRQRERALFLGGSAA